MKSIMFLIQSIAILFVEQPRLSYVKYLKQQTIRFWKRRVGLVKEDKKMWEESVPIMVAEYCVPECLLLDNPESDCPTS